LTIHKLTFYLPHACNACTEDCEQPASISFRLLELATDIACGHARINTRHLHYQLAQLLSDPDTFLVQACRRGQYVYAQLLLSFGANVHYECDEPLFEAVWHGHARVAQLLISSGADVNARDSICLQIAAHKGYSKVVKLLLEHSADVSVDNYNALRKAFKKNRYEVVKMLVERGAKLSALEANALPSAVDHGNVDMVQLLIKHGLRVDVNSARMKEAIAGAGSKGHWDVIRLLHAHGATPPEPSVSVSAVRVIVEKGDIETLTFLLRHTTFGQDEMLIYEGACVAAQRDNLEMLHLLLQQAASVKNYGRVLALAAANGSSDMVKTLLQHGVVLAEDIPLGALMRLRRDVVEMLLSHSTDPVRHFKLEMTFAAIKGDVQLVKMLASHFDKVGIRQDVRQDLWVRALYAAYNHKCEQLVRCLLQDGVDVVATLDGMKMCADRAGLARVLIEHLGQTDVTLAAIFAAGAGLYELAERYLAQGADVSDPYYFEGYVLKVSQNHFIRSTDVYALLISYGADCTIQCNLALRDACMAGDLATVKLLLDHGADIHDSILKCKDKEVDDVTGNCAWHDYAETLQRRRRAHSTPFACYYPPYAKRRVEGCHSALHEACKQHDTDLIRYLLAHGADPSMRGAWFLFESCLLKEHMQLFIEHGLDVRGFNVSTLDAGMRD
jgi:ankyrin repeat protein